MNMKQAGKTILPLAGMGVVAGTAFLMMKKPSKRQRKMQKRAGRAIKAVGEAVEHFHGNFTI